MTLYKKNEECTSYKRCKKYRVCEKCNNIRQAKLSDITELAARFSPRATYTVIMPKAEAQVESIIKAVKSKITRKVKQSVDGTFISVETSKNDALHLNILTMGQSIITPEPFKAVIKKMGIAADLYHEEVATSDIRNITAYALKMQSLPTKDQYSGNLYNITGSVRNAKNIMQSQKMFKYAPAVAVLSMCNTLIKWGIKPPTEKMLKFNSMQAITESLCDLVNQIDTQEICYSKKNGLLNKADFITLYNKRNR